MTILQSTLEALRARLDAALQVAEPRSEEWVTLGNAADPDGRAVESARDKIVMTLAGLHSDPALHNLPNAAPAESRAAGSPALYVNASVLFLANFSGSTYPAGLGMLSRTIGFFQQNPVFTHDRLPGLAPEVDKITMTFVNLDLTQTSALMGMLGLRYLPCALYRLTTLPFAGDALTRVARK